MKRSNAAKFEKIINHEINIEQNRKKEMNEKKDRRKGSNFYLNPAD